MEFERGTTLDRETYRSGASEPPTKKERSARPVYVFPSEDAGKDRVALFCFEDPNGVIGQRLGKTAAALAKRGKAVHLFSRHPFELSGTGIHQHPIGDCAGADIAEQVDEFGSRACNRFMRELPDCRGVTLLGCEWSSIGAMSTLHGLKGLPYLLSLESVERQRGDLSSDLSQTIEESERTGLREARAILYHDQATAAAAAQVFDCGDRLVQAFTPFPTESFDCRIDPGEVKARYQIGPVDPLVLYVGDLADHYGPDLIVKALPAVLKNNNQVRFVAAGCGDLYWPMRVYTRYLLLEHAVRLVGDVRGRDMYELMCAADVVVAPSRQPTPWWAIQAAWAARRPLVATHETAPSLLRHEEDCVLCYPNVNSCVWGIERVLFNPELGAAIAARGHARLEELFGWNMVAQQIEQLMGARQAV